MTACAWCGEAPVLYASPGVPLVVSVDATGIPRPTCYDCFQRVLDRFSRDAR